MTAATLEAFLRSLLADAAAATAAAADGAQRARPSDPAERPFFKISEHADGERRGPVSI